jgi:hypothetical protein
MDKKCTACGSTHLREITAYREQYLDSSVIAYVCEDCFHVEFYANNQLENQLKNTLDNERKTNERNVGIDKLISEKKVLLDEIQSAIRLLTNESDELKKRSEDESITVKEQKELLLKIKDIEKQIVSKTNESNSMKSTMLGLEVSKKRHL